ncbi:MAG: TraR/DksA family transcriptional regulator [Deltaproteobacteria bacterium]
MTKTKEIKPKEQLKKKPSAKPLKHISPNTKEGAVKKETPAMPPPAAEPEPAHRQGEIKPAPVFIDLTWRLGIKDMLLQMRRELIKEVSQSIRNESDYLRFDVGDFYDHASNDRDRELSLMITDRDRGKLVQIDEALRKIEDGSYGVCDICGDDVGEDRLRAMPFAKLCLSCQIDLERQGRDL